MATTTINFTGKEQQAVTFPAVLNNATYRCEIKWNLAGQRWFLSLFNSNTVRILTVPLVESGTNTTINLVAGYFADASIIWRADIGKLEIVS